MSLPQCLRCERSRAARTFARYCNRGWATCSGPGPSLTRPLDSTGLRCPRRFCSSVLTLPQTWVPPGPEHVAHPLWGLARRHCFASLPSSVTLLERFPGGVEVLTVVTLKWLVERLLQRGRKAPKDVSFGGVSISRLRPGSCRVARQELEEYQSSKRTRASLPQGDRHRPKIARASNKKKCRVLQRTSVLPLSLDDASSADGRCSGPGGTHV